MNALRLSRALHVICIVALAAVAHFAQLHWPYFVGVTGVSLLLLAEHVVVSPADLSRINLAFFTINSWVGIVLLCFTSLDIYLYG